jgi:hypothetical protein
MDHYFYDIKMILALSIINDKSENELIIWDYSNLENGNNAHPL